MLKRIISLAVLVSVFTCVFTSCATIQKVKDFFDPNVRSYNEALELIEDKEYRAAYDILKAIEDYEPAKEELKKFRFVMTDMTDEYTNSDGDTDKNSSTYYYNENGLLVQHIRTYMGVQSINEYEYDANGNITKHVYIESNGNKTTYEYTYDENGNKIKEVYTYNNDEPQTTNFTYDESGKLLTEYYLYDNGNGRSVTEYTYDKNGNLIKKAQKYIYTHEGVTTESDGSYTDYTYDVNGNKIKEVESYGTGKNVSDLTYDADGNLLKWVFSSVDNFGNRIVNYTYDYTYDAKGNKIKEVYTGSNGSSSISEYTYDENGNVTQYYDSWGDIWELYKITYDANGNAINIDYETSQGHKINCDLTYDADNNCIKIVMDSSDNVGEVYTAQYKLVYIPFEIDEDMYEDLLDIF